MKNILKLTAILFAITAVVAALLAGANLLTKDRIAAAKAEKLLQSVAQVLPGGENAQQIDFVTEDDSGVKAIYQNENGYAVQVETAGFGGMITVMVGVSNDAKVLGVRIVSHSETPSLGARAESDASFRDSFVGLDGFVQVSKDGGEADTLTGATVTSRAVADAVNMALAAVRSLG